MPKAAMWQIAESSEYGMMVRIPDEIYTAVRNTYKDCGCVRTSSVWPMAFLYITGPPWRPRIGDGERYVVQTYATFSPQTRDEFLSPSVVLSLLL